MFNRCNLSSCVCVYMSKRSTDERGDRNLTLFLKFIDMF